MSLICPQCSQVNQDSTVFCRSCGYRFQGNESEVSEEATIRPASLANVPADADPADTLRPAPPVSQPTPAPVTPQPQPQAPYGVPAPTPAQAQSPFFAQPVPSAQQGGYPPQQQQQQQIYAQYPGQAPYGTPAGLRSPVAAPPASQSVLQRGFAGKGTPVHHQSWLLDGKQVPPQNLQSGFVSQLQQQKVLGIQVEPERLREQGTVLEERDYIKVRYNISSVFVYMAPMGQNLYVSRTSTIQQPYSKIRMAVAISLAVLMLLSLIFYVVINPIFDPLNPGVFGLAETIRTFFSYAFFGLLFFFIIAVLRSLVFWLTDRDFLALLRPNRLNDFSLDALSSIEQTTDKALRAALQEAGLDGETITLAQHANPQQPLHRI